MAGDEAVLDPAIARHAEQLDADVTSGMARNLSQGRRTESRKIDGELVRRAVRLGVAVPANQVLLAAMEATGG